MRYSRQKDIVFSVLDGRKDHPSADTIFNETRKILPHISLGTVYRNLERLAVKGKIRIIDGVAGGRRYDPDVSDHYHFICLNCGKVEDIPFVVDYPDITAKHSWFRNRVLVAVEMSFKGYCEQCAGTAEISGNKI